MTPPEPTDEPLGGTKSRDTDTQGNKHAETTQLLADERAAAEKAQERDDVIRGIGPWVVSSILTAAMVGALVIANQRDRSHYNKSNAQDNKPPPQDVASAQQHVRSALKDPAVTNRIIEQVKDPLVIQKFMDDPEIMENLRKLATAIEGNVKKNPGNWADKATEGKGPQSLKRN